MEKKYQKPEATVYEIVEESIIADSGGTGGSGQQPEQESASEYRNNLFDY